MALQSPLALLEPMRHGAALQRLVQDHDDTLANLREGHRRSPCFFPRAVSRTKHHVASNDSV